MNNHRKQITYGAIFSYLHIAIGAIITLVYTPFMIRTLGQSEYGLYNTVSSVISSLSILSLGFGSSYIKFYSKYKANSQHDEIKKLNGMFIIIFTLIGVIALVCGMFLSYNLRFVFKDGLTEHELKIAKVLMILLTINLSITFPASVFTSIITAHERFIYQKIMVMIRQIVSPLICIPILLMGYASIGMVISTVCISVIIDIINVLFCLNKLDVKFYFGCFDLKTFKELVFFSGFIALNMVVDQINLNVDKILLGRFCGTSSVAVYSAGYTLYNYYASFSTSISNVFTSRIHHIWNNSKLTIEERDYQLSRLFSKVGQIQFIILWLVVTGLFLFGRQFICLWAGRNYSNAYYVVVILAFSAIVPLSQNLGIEIQRAKNKHHFRSLLYIFMAIVNLVLSIFLCQIWGEIGSSIGTAFSFIIANTIIMDVFYYKYLNIKIGLYWRTCAKVVVSCVPAYIVGIILTNFFKTDKPVYLFFLIFFYSIIYICCIAKFILTNETKRKIIKMIKQRCIRS